MVHLTTRRATLCGVVLAAALIYGGIAALAQGQWSGAALSTPNSGALTLTAGGGAGACDPQHRTFLTRLGMKASDKAAIALDCPAEMAVFRKDAAMAMIPFGASAHVPTTALPRADRRIADVKFVVLADCFNAAAVRLSRFACATAHLAIAERIFDEQLTGIAFPAPTTPGLFTDRVSAPQAGELRVACDDHNLSTLASASPPRTASITVYYVKEIIGARGITCGEGEIIIIGGTAGSKTLAHEFGHAFASNLLHFDSTVGAALDTRNLMRDSEFRGERLTLGQSFRFNMNVGSRLNTPGPPPFPPRPCGRDATAQCPPVPLDPRP